MKQNLWCLQYGLEFTDEISAYYYTLLPYALMHKNVANPTVIQESGGKIVVMYLCRKLCCVWAQYIPVGEDYYW